jgi:hypothetical protein
VSLDVVPVIAVDQQVHTGVLILADQIDGLGNSTLVFLLYQKGGDSRIFQAQDRAIDDPLPTTSLARVPQASRNSASTKERQY